MVVSLTIDCFRSFRLIEIIAKLSESTMWFYNIMTSAWHFQKEQPMFFGMFGTFFIWQRPSVINRSEMSISSEK